MITPGTSELAGVGINGPPGVPEVGVDVGAAVGAVDGVAVGSVEADGVAVGAIVGSGVAVGVESTAF